MVLLNRVLTVAPGQIRLAPGKGWEPITERMRSAPWPPARSRWWRSCGDATRAQTLTPILRDHGVPVLTSAHPSPLSAHRGFFRVAALQRANAALIAQGGVAIDWSLP